MWLRSECLFISHRPKLSAHHCISLQWGPSRRSGGSMFPWNKWPCASLVPPNPYEALFKDRNILCALISLLCVSSLQQPPEFIVNLVSHCTEVLIYMYEAQHHFKGEACSKKLTILSSPIARKHSAFPLTDVSASKSACHPKEIYCKSTENQYLEVTILKLFLAGRLYLTSFCPTWNWREAEKPAADFVSFTRSAKCFFYKLLSE